MQPASPTAGLLDDSEHFIDHTLATPFEIVSRRLESAIVSLLANLKEDTRVVDTGDKITLLLRLHYAPSPPADPFSTPSFASRWFGVSGWFFVLVPFSTDPSTISQTSPTPDTCAYWLSTVSVALAVVDCRLPCFLASRPSYYNTHVGISTSAHFESTVQAYPPNESLGRLDGVVRRFASPAAVVCHARLSYFVPPPRPSALLSHVQLSALWPGFPKGAHAENEFHSTLKPHTDCHNWTLTAVFACDTPLHAPKAIFAGPEALPLLASKLDALARNNGPQPAWKQALRELGLSRLSQSLSGHLASAAVPQLVAKALAHPESPLGALCFDLQPDFAAQTLRELVRTLRARFEQGRGVLDHAVTRADPGRARGHQLLVVLDACARPGAAAAGPVDAAAAALDPALGRLRQLDFCLESDPAQPCFEPVTQQRAGVVPQALELLEGPAIAELLSPVLVADMKAFRFANPGCGFADFVRWFSPKDYAPGRGLSARMQSEDNLWAKAWDKAPPQPAREQRPLFDPTVEGEKALHWFETVDLDELLRDHVLPEGCRLLKLQLLKEASEDDARLLASDDSIDTLMAVETRVRLKRALVNSHLDPDACKLLLDNDFAAPIPTDLALKLLGRDVSVRPDKKEYICQAVDSSERLYSSVENGEYRECLVVGL